MRDRSSLKRLGYVAGNVLRSPLSLAIWAAGGAAAFVLGDVWPVGVGAAAALQAALLYRRLNDEEFLRGLFAARERDAYGLSDEQVEASLERMDFETRQRVRYILQLQREIVREARAEDVASYARHELERIAGELAPLMHRAIRIAGRKQQLTRYLHNHNEKALANYCSSLRQRIEATEDPVTRSQYEQALKARESEVQTYAAIAQAAARIDGQLESVEATFASWKARVIRIKTVDVASAASVSEGLTQELASLNQDIDLLEGSVTEALSGEEDLVVRQAL
ncbi:MAG TPA: hypothetical protein VLH79_14640 [Chthonomonadales bacterium]|nr:hypothetical protein [Chthonomonadales bacterium]